MTPTARAFVLHRLGDCPDLPALKRVWDSLGVEMKTDPVVVATKDALKENLE